MHVKITTSGPRRSLDHDPVLGAVVVHLERQTGSRLDDQALYLVKGTVVHALVVAPGADALPANRF